MHGINTIEFYQKDTDSIINLRLYRVMSIGHLDRPNEAARYKATMRFCQPLADKRNPTEKRGFKEQEVIIPECLKDSVFEAFNKDLFVLAGIENGCITAMTIVKEPINYDVGQYERIHGQPYKALNGDL